MSRRATCAIVSGEKGPTGRRRGAHRPSGRGGDHIPSDARPSTAANGARAGASKRTPAMRARERETRMTGRVSRGVAIVVAVLFTVGLGGTAVAQKKLENIPLVWKPTTKAGQGSGVTNLSGLMDVKIQVDPFVDTRENKAKFGENQEDKAPRAVTTSGNVADFATQNFRNALKQYGLNIVPSGGDVVIGGDILEFMVVESNTYKGDARIKLYVKKRS